MGVSMLIIPHNAKVYLALSTVDFRKQIRGLKKWIRNEMSMDPLSMAYYIFLSKNRKTIKIFHFDGQGSCLHCKQLAEDRFKDWNGIHEASAKLTSIHSLEAQLMYLNGSARQIETQKNWQV
jgi:transposase